MGTFLNSTVPFNAYQATASGTYFVDKTSLLNELLPAIGTEERCIKQIAEWEEERKNAFSALPGPGVLAKAL